MNDNRDLETRRALLHEKYIFRDVRKSEAAITAEIESICFPPNEACSLKHMTDRVDRAPEFLLVAEDKTTGKIAGLLSGLATDREHLTDNFFTDARVHDPAGANIMLLGLDVLPEYRSQGLARELVEQYKEREKAKGRKKLILTCLPAKVSMYESFGFKNRGIGVSEWGGEAWYEMCLDI